MKIAIVGAGIIGVTTAYELAVDGHEVTVFERRSAAAEEASFANAGIISPGWTLPGAPFGMPHQLLTQRFSAHAHTRLGYVLSLKELGFLWRWLRACQSQRYLSAFSRMQRLAAYSQSRLLQLRQILELDYEYSAGSLILLRSERERKKIEPQLKLLRDAGVVLHEINAAKALQIEPALRPDTPLAAAIHMPDDEVGNCRQFAQLMRTQAEGRGVQFVFNSVVQAIHPGPQAAVQLMGQMQPQPFDAVVLCAGVDSVKLLRPLRIRLPLLPVYGYSISAQIRERLNAPNSALWDHRYRVTLSRQGARVRVAGGAELGTSATGKNKAAFDNLYKVLQDWFPQAALMSAGGIQEWRGARPALPDGPPVLGASGLKKIWLNLGHGNHGWALSCGSARVLADLISQRSPDVDLQGFSIERYR